jgi:hypothetical protein
MNSKFPRQMGSLRENPPHTRRLPSVVMAIGDDGTIGTSRGVARYKSPFVACQQSLYFGPARYRVVNIVCSCFEVVL